MKTDGMQRLRMRRLGVLVGVATLGYGLLLARSVELQVVQADELEARQRPQSSQLEELPALRGDVVDRHGTLLATSVLRYEVLVANPAGLSPADRARILRAVRAASGEEHARLESKLQGKHSLVQLAHGLSEDQVAQLRSAQLPGVRFASRRSRSYPSRGLPGQTLGAAFIGFEGQDPKPLEGIEIAFDEFLTGNRLRRSVQRDGRRRRRLDHYASLDERRGQVVQLTLDSRLQLEAERALGHALEQTGAASGSLIALDPKNGDLLAVAEAPGFDPNRFWREDEERFRTQGIQASFEPGSTLKPFVVAIALESGAISLEEEFDCGEGRMRIGNRVIRDVHPHGMLRVADALRVSSNICMARVAERLGAKALVRGLEEFGFGQPPGTGFPGEAVGVLRQLTDDQPVDRANLAFGQGMRASALQLALAGAILANEGRRVRPRLALQIGEWHPPAGTSDEQVVSKATAREVLEMMAGVVRDGTGRAAALQHYDVAGKTGTSQKFVDGAYSHERFVTSFLGIAPVEDPRIVVVIMLDEPERHRTGGGSAAPAFREFAEAALGKLEVVARMLP